MSALGRPQDMFSDTAIQLQPVFAQWIQNTHFTAPQLTAPNALAATSLTWGGDVVAVGGKVAMMPISLGTADFLVWVAMDQVKLRYMLEQLVRNLGPYSQNKSFFLGGFSKCKLTFKVPTYKNVAWKALQSFEQIKKNLTKIKNLVIYSTFVFWGIGENPNVRVNQQVTKSFDELNGTSETIREAVSSFNFSDYKINKPQHIKDIDPLFLECHV
jgi:hypothetical protein